MSAGSFGAIVVAAALLTGCFPDPPKHADATAEDAEVMDAVEADVAEVDVAEVTGGDADDTSDVTDVSEVDAVVAADGGGETDSTPVDTSMDVADTAPDTVEPDTMVADTVDAADAVEVDTFVPECDGPEDCTRLDAECVRGVCQDGTCVTSKLTGDDCDDGLKCTDHDVCDDGVCTGTAVVCTALDQCHDIGECDPGSGECSSPALSGIDCDDGLKCTENDQCTGGVCAGTAVVCIAVDD